MPETAYFVRQPRRIKDLFILHAVDRERPYEIVKTVALPLIDYENFISDLTVDREFLENNASLCSMGSIWKCLLIKRENHDDGVLVIPMGWLDCVLPGSSGMNGRTIGVCADHRANRLKTKNWQIAPAT